VQANPAPPSHASSSKTDSTSWPAVEWSCGRGESISPAAGKSKTADAWAEQRLDATIAARFQNQYVRVRRCAQLTRELPPPLQAVAAKAPRWAGKPKRKPVWMNNFSLRSGPTKESMSSKPKPSAGDFVAVIRGSVADAFFGVFHAGFRHNER
jgi:hypothetical protein